MPDFATNRGGLAGRGGVNTPPRAAPDVASAPGSLGVLEDEGVFPAAKGTPHRVRRLARRARPTRRALLPILPVSSPNNQLAIGNWVLSTFAHWQHFHSASARRSRMITRCRSLPLPPPVGRSGRGGLRPKQRWCRRGKAARSRRDGVCGRVVGEKSKGVAVAHEPDLRAYCSLASHSLKNGLEKR